MAPSCTRNALVAELRRRGHDAESVALPFRAHKSELLDQACAWRMLDLSSSNGRPDRSADRDKVSDLVRAPSTQGRLGDASASRRRTSCSAPSTVISRDSDDDGRLRRQIIDLDSRMLGECRRIVTNAQNTADRLKRFNGIVARPLYHPPPIADRLRGGAYGDYVLVVARLEPLKRVELVIRAMAHVPAPVRLIVVGEGSRARGARA